MKYTTEIIISQKRTRVIEFFDNSENLYKWQEGLKHIEAISGVPGQEGAQSKLVYEARKGDLEMTETITKRNLPDEFHGVYRARGVYNEMYNYFAESEGNKTIWRTVCIFKFHGLMALMAPFMKAAFAKNTLLTMERFKSLAEKYNPQ